MQELDTSVLTAEDWQAWRKSNMPLDQWVLIHNQQNNYQQNNTTNNVLVVQQSVWPDIMRAILGFSLVWLAIGFVWYGGWILLILGLVLYIVYRILKAIGKCIPL